MKSTGIFHPEFFYHARPTVESAMIADVEIFSPTGEQTNWVPGVGIEDNLYVKRWEGKARVQPNKDWRARAREQGLEFGATQAVRIQVGIGTNKLTGPNASEDFSKDWLVIVTNSDVVGTEVMEGTRYYVRNAEKSSNAWLHNLLCDTNTREGDHG